MCKDDPILQSTDAAEPRARTVLATFILGFLGKLRILVPAPT